MVTDVMVASDRNTMSKFVATQFRTKANEFLKSRQNANHLAEILESFEIKSDNYSSILLAIELIFVELLKRGELRNNAVPLKPAASTPDHEYSVWLRECYESAWSRVLRCTACGRAASRSQAVVTAMRLLATEAKHLMETSAVGKFPFNRLKSIMASLLNAEENMIPVIGRFQEYCEYDDVVQNGLNVLSSMSLQNSSSNTTFILNYLELLDRLLPTVLDKAKKGTEKDQKKVLCAENFIWNQVQCRRHASKCWWRAARWPLAADPRTHRRALLLLVERAMPLLHKPHMLTDLLMDSLDAGGPISMLALQGVLELVQCYNMEYPDIYTRLYAMLEPEMFVTRYKARLLYLTDIFLSSTHLPESLVAAFAKRLSRLALLAPPQDIVAILCLIGNLLLRHPALKRMMCAEDPQVSMSSDPYVSEESIPNLSCALASSWWEIAALRQHALPSVCGAATRVLQAATDTSAAPWPLSEALDRIDDDLFAKELKKKFKSIESNFVSPVGASLSTNERLRHYFVLTQ